MIDYTWPSVYFAYLFFTLSAVLCLFFLIRSWKDGYWGKDGEEVKYQVFDTPPAAHASGCSVDTRVDGSGTERTSTRVSMRQAEAGATKEQSDGRE